MLAIRMRRRNLMRCRRMANKAKRLDAEIVFVRNMAAYDSNNCMATDRQIILDECRAAVASRNRMDNRLARVRNL